MSRRYIVAGALIDGSGSESRKNVYLAVEDGIIAAIDSAFRLPSATDAPVDDFSHCVILPALIDCSVSLARSPAVGEPAQHPSRESSPAEGLKLIGRHLDYCHAHGVLGIADDGYGRDPAARLGNGPERVEIAIRTAAALIDAGADFLKIPYSAGIADPGGAATAPDYPALCRVLQRRGEKKAVVVANGERQVAEAIEAGCDAIEQGYGMGRNNLEKMAEKNILWIPSVLQAKNALDGSASGGDVCCRFSLRYVAPGKAVPGGEAFWKKVLADQLAQLRLARAIGVKTAVGTGAGGMGILHGESVAEEMKLFLKAGYTLEETFRSASENGARFFGMEGLGALAAGRRATFLITRGTAQQLPRKLSYLEAMYIDGAPSSVYRKNPVKGA